MRTKARKACWFVAAFAVPAIALSSWHLRQCEDECPHGSFAELKWRTWLAGASGSSQFHFVDSMELLYRFMHPAPKREESDAFMDSQ
ncbi:hypothetical protein [Ferrimonas aestuarii]|uniref:Secreted protein n=1 Tax=Ferrimonas aestuarii TaxID=2569539 RepID=A0A4U1BGJ3_9GAMM|nr:hypothetical protein [Ferrimonas aestuarii]TKB49139.1 hypothetical protein FCL42_21180 [Ferrimonas aestuarii]